MKKILLVVHELTYSGSPNSTLRLARALCELNYRVETWSYKDGPFRIEYEKYGVNISIVTKEDLRKRTVIRKIKKFDLMIANSILTCEALEAISTIIPSIWYIREAENIPSFFENNYKRGLVLKKCENILTVSEYAAEYIHKFFNTNVQILHNCVDDVYELYQKMECNNIKIKIIMIGTIERRKNFALLIDAFLSLPDNYRQYLELHLVGRVIENERNYYDNIALKIETNDDIFFYGEIQDRNELMSLIAQMDVVAVVSSDESCSLTALEGAMMAKPLLLSENIGAKYLVDHANGWIVKTDSKTAIQEAMIQIYENKGILKEMGRESRKRYEDTSTFEIYKNNVRNVIKRQKNFKSAYYFSHTLKRMIWYFDDTDKYFKYPEWGYEGTDKHLYSYDIFDTLITRDVATPIGIFDLMQKELYENPQFEKMPEYVRENFVDLRIGAEGFARQSYCVNGIEDKTLDQIYEAFLAIGKIDCEMANSLKLLEIETEIKHSIGIEENIADVRKLVLEGKNVVLISDMYLPSEIIRKMLLKADKVFAEIPIYVSSECKTMKGTTHLFKYVQSKEKISFTNWTHTGDNINADINTPNFLGISCVHFTGAQLSDIEKKLLKNRERDYFVQSIIGLDRKLRFMPFNDFKIDEFIINAIRILIPFIYSVIENDDVKKNNYKYILCTGQFGYLIYELFGDVLKKSDFEMICLPQWAIDYRRNKQPIKELAKIIEFDMCEGLLNILDFCNIFNISVEELNSHISRLSVSHLNIDDTESLCFLLEDSIFLKFLDRKRYDLLENLKRYLTNTIYLDFEFVDISAFYGIDNTNSFYFTAMQVESELNIKPVFYRYLSLNDEEKNVCKYIFFKAYENIKLLGEECNLIRRYIAEFPNQYKLIHKRESVHSFEKDILKILQENYKEEVDKFTEKEYKIYSFGLHETLLTYDLANKEGIYLLIKRHMIKEALKYGYTYEFIDNYIDIRKEAEIKVANLYSAKIVKSKSLDEIYNYIYMITNVPYRAINHLQRYERNMIKKHSIGIPENITKVRHLVNNNNRVIILADTWYDYDLVYQLLCDIDPVFYGIKLYTTSCCESFIDEPEVFFAYVRDSEKISTEKWHHIGNDLKFDINRPTKLGITTERTLSTKLLPYENAALEEFGNQLSVQAKIGSAKINRLIYQGSNEHVIGNALGGPMLYSYVQWVLDDAINRKIRKLLFVARDGFILKLIADIIIQAQNLDIETEYVYGSRKAWRMPSYSADENLEIFFKMAHIDQLKDIKTFSQIFNISCDELIMFLPVEYQDPRCKLVKQDYKLIREYLENNEDFCNYLEKKAKNERCNIVRYFKDICGNSTFAFVELSGTGSTQNCLAKIMGDVTSERIYTYFLNLDSLKRANNATFLNYIPNNIHNIWVIETLCRAPHGQTDRYEEKDNKIVPVLSQSLETEALLKHGYMEYICGVLHFTRQFSQADFLDITDKESPILFQKYLNHIRLNPCKEVLEFIGDMPFETTGFNDDVQIFAPKLTEKQMEQIFLTRGDESIDTYYTGASLDYSLKRMSQEEHEKIEHYRNAIATKEGRRARNKKRLEEKGIKYTIAFLYKRAIREILLKIGLIKY